VLSYNEIAPYLKHTDEESKRAEFQELLLKKAQQNKVSINSGRTSSNERRNHSKEKLPFDRDNNKTVAIRKSVPAPS